MRKKILVWGAVIFLVLILLALIAQFVFLGYAYDQKISSLINKAEQKVPGLSLSYQPGASGFASREGQLTWTYQLPDDAVPGFKTWQGGADLKVSFEVLGVEALLLPKHDQGNTAQLLHALGLDGVNYEGHFNASLLPFGAGAELTFDPVNAKVSDGQCSLQGQSLGLDAGSTNTFTVKVNGGQIECVSSLNYAGEPAYKLHLEQAQLDAEVSRSSGQLSLSGLNVKLSGLKAQISTPYAIGFNPDDEVRDISLQDALSADDIEFKLTSEDTGSGFANWQVQGSGKVGLGLPYIKQGQREDLKVIELKQLAAVAGPINLMQILKTLQHAPDSLMTQLMHGLASPFEFQLNTFDLDYAGENINASGQARAVLDSDSGRMQQADASFDLKAGKQLIVQLLESDDDQKQLNDWLQRGAVTEDGADYKTKLELKAGQLLLNGQQVM